MNVAGSLALNEISAESPPRSSSNRLVFGGVWSSGVGDELASLWGDELARLWGDGLVEGVTDPVLGDPAGWLSSILGVGAAPIAGEGAIESVWSGTWVACVCAAADVLGSEVLLWGARAVDVGVSTR